VGVLAGPYAAAAILLGLGGALKLRRPAPTAAAMASVGLPRSLALVRILGAGEVVVAGGALTVGHPLFALLVGLAYVAFSGFVVVALGRGGVLNSCGCFGEPDTPATPVHVVLDLAAAAVAFAVAAGGRSDWPSLLRDQPLGGVPFVVLTATAAYLGYVVLSVLPTVSRRGATAPGRG
jgi:hypothetical protein